jgi:hypothetical protein
MIKKSALIALCTLVSSAAHGVVLLTVTLPSESPGRLTFTPVPGVISSNANALAVNINAGLVLGRLVGQVALLDFASQAVSWQFIVGTTDPMTLGSSFAPDTFAYSDEINDFSGPHLQLGGGSNTTAGTLEAFALNPFGTSAWQSAAGPFDPTLVNLTGDIIVVTSTVEDGFSAEVIGQWAVIPEPRHASFLFGALALGFLVRRRWKGQALRD